jgi:hypothetical protein
MQKEGCVSRTPFASLKDVIVGNMWIHRIHMFLGLPNPDPDPLVRGMDPDPALDPDPDSFYHHAKIVRKTLIPTILWLFLTFYL